MGHHVDFIFNYERGLKLTEISKIIKDFCQTFLNLIGKLMGLVKASFRIFIFVIFISELIVDSVHLMSQKEIHAGMQVVHLACLQVGQGIFISFAQFGHFFGKRNSKIGFIIHLS